MKELDARGLYCPDPVMLLHKALAELAGGECLKVIATDPTTRRDIPQFCRHLGHELLSVHEVEPEADSAGADPGELIFELRKGQGGSPTNS